MLDKTLYSIRRFIPTKVFNFFNPTYHWLLSFFSALYYGFPSKRIKVIAVTGTKGKSSTTEIINAILETAGHKTALSNTIRYKIGDESYPNLFKMSTPGRFFLQKLIREAVDSNCKYIILEMTSQGAMHYRHQFVEIDTLIFTNLSPEHITAHGSYDNYRLAKLSIAKKLENSSKSAKTIIVNGDDKEAPHFLASKVDHKITFSIKDVEPYKLDQSGIDFTFDKQNIHSNLQGLFNLYNILAAITYAKDDGVNTQDIIKAIQNLNHIPGRLERIKAKDFEVIVDYAHTADSLTKIYEVFKHSPIIGVLGGTGGGRDSDRREVMGKIADSYCKEIIITNEDPYDEDPNQIIADVAKGVTQHQPIIIIDRREAIRKAITIAKPGDTVIISGKGTDPYIMGPNNTKIPWSDSSVTKDELQKLGLLTNSSTSK